MSNLEVVQGKVFDVIGVADAVIAQMSEKYLPLKIKGLDDKAGYKAVHDARMVVKDTRVKVEKKRKELKEDALRYGQAIDKEANRIKGLLEPVEAHLTEEEKAVDDALEAIKKKKERQEEIRIQARRDRLAALGVGFNGQMWTYQNENLPDALLKIASDEQFEQFANKFQEAVEAEKEKKTAEEAKRKEEEERLAKMAAEQEAERQRFEAIKREQEEEERKRHIREKLEADERERQAEALRKEEKRIADEKAEWERIKKAEQDEIKHRQELDVVRREAAEKARLQAIEDVKREAEEKAEQERLAKIAAEKKEARRPDKERLIAFADNDFFIPTMKTQEGLTIINEFKIEFDRAIKNLRTKAEAL
ncbi:MAG: hypothetical protein PHD04_03955 [Candidatus Pacebacteria bacterium]|nr:hypothetical protein [Candidatus Paceibacterota bacterium]